MPTGVLNFFRFASQTNCSSVAIKPGLVGGEALVRDSECSSCVRVQSSSGFKAGQCILPNIFKQFMQSNSTRSPCF